MFHSSMELTLTRNAYDKMLYLARKSDKEVGGWGIANDPNDSLLIDDFVLTEQEVTCSSIDWDSDDIAAFRAEHRKAGYHIDQYIHVHCHTHPGSSAEPSGMDWDTLKNIFMKELVHECAEAKKHNLEVQPPWMIMLIIAKGGECTAHLAYYIMELDEIIVAPITVLVECVENSAQEEWDREYKANVTTPAPSGFGAYYPNQVGQGQGHVYPYTGDPQHRPFLGGSPMTELERQTLSELGGGVDVTGDDYDGEDGFTPSELAATHLLASAEGNS